MTVFDRAFALAVGLFTLAALSGCQSYDRKEAYALVEKLESKNQEEWQKTIMALTEMGSGPADLVIDALKDESHQRRYGAMVVISGWDGLSRSNKGDVPPAKILSRALAHDDVAIRYQAAILLGKVSEARVWPKALPVLQQAANDTATETYNVPVQTTYAVGKKVSTIYHAEKVPARAAAIGALWDLRLPEGPDLILNALKTPDKWLVYELRTRLLNDRDGRASAQLEQALTTAEAKLGLPVQAPPSE